MCFNMGGIGVFTVVHIYPYVLLHREIIKNDENVNEPILERGMITRVGRM